MYKASIIITAYQAEQTITRALRSVLDTPRRSEIEVIVVDDCSTDRTGELVEQLCRQYENLRFLRMPRNSGGPSEPRNRGIAEAQGQYISVLDDDDYYDMDAFFKALDAALADDLDFVKGYLIVHEGSRVYDANRLVTKPAQGKPALREIISHLSLTQDFLIKREILQKKELRYDASLKIGEDTAFLSEALACCQSIAYLDIAYLHYCKTPAISDNLSSTQRWGDREIRDQLEAWRRAERNLRTAGLSYYELRLPSAFRNVLLSLVRYSDGISETRYRELNAFTKEADPYLRKKMMLAARYQELYDAILAGDYEGFCKVQRRRLLIAGFDLKFIHPLIPYFEKEFSVQVDEWTGHNAHDEGQSRKLLKWADIIWCEWLLGNAVFYSRNKAPYQRLVIRAHRFEATREFGSHVDYSKVDLVFAVSYYFMELFSRRFQIPRNKMRLLSNYVESDIYAASRESGTAFDLGIVGILPSRKGYLKALELLRVLRQKDPRFVLHVCGDVPENVSWIWADDKERAYFESCRAFIADNHLEDAVLQEGFKPREHLYDGIGIVLSTSDADGVPESFHLAPAEGACAGAMGLLLRWPGAEYIYPSSVIYDSTDKLASEILRLAGEPEYYSERKTMLGQYVKDNYDISSFLKTVRMYLTYIRIMN